MDSKRPGGPEEQRGVPKGPEDAATHGNRGELRLQVKIQLAGNWGIVKLYIGGDKFAMKIDLYCTLG